MVLADWNSTFATAQKSANSQAAWAICYQVRLGVHLDLRLPGRAGKLCWDCIGRLTAAVNNLHFSPDIGATTPCDLQAHMKQVLQCDQACQHEETRVAATACLRLMGQATTGVLECILHHCPQQFTALAREVQAHNAAFQRRSVVCHHFRGLVSTGWLLLRLHNA